MIVITLVLFLVFRSNNIFEATTLINQLGTFESKYNFLTYVSMKFIVALVVGILGMGMIQKIFGGIYSKIQNTAVVVTIDHILQIGILIFSILSIVDGTYNPFIYFQF